MTNAPQTVCSAGCNVFTKMMGGSSMGKKSFYAVSLVLINGGVCMKKWQRESCRGKICLD